MTLDPRLVPGRDRHTKAELDALLRYNPETGKVHWRVQRGSIREGAEAKTPHPDGYLTVGIDGQSYLLHRVIWCMVYGEFPQHILDHEDLNRENNRITNIRPATSTQNCCNTKMRTDNTSGVKGVSWHKRTAKWIARVNYENKQIYRSFDDKDEAEKFVRAKRAEFHKQFDNDGVLK